MRSFSPCCFGIVGFSVRLENLLPSAFTLPHPSTCFLSLISSFLKALSFFSIVCSHFKGRFSDAKCCSNLFLPITNFHSIHQRLPLYPLHLPNTSTHVLADLLSHRDVRVWCFHSCRLFPSILQYRFIGLLTFCVGWSQLSIGNFFLF